LILFPETPEFSASDELNFGGSIKSPLLEEPRRYKLFIQRTQPAGFFNPRGTFFLPDLLKTFLSLPDY
jgi:hypothetical protein